MKRLLFLLSMVVVSVLPMSSQVVESASVEATESTVPANNPTAPTASLRTRAIIETTSNHHRDNYER